VPAVFVARGKANMLRTAALLSAVASVTAFAPRVPRAIARTALNAAEEEDAPAFLANAEVVILHRSKSSLAAVAYELAAALEGLESVGVGVATAGDADDAAALRAVEGVRTVTPADGLSGYDDALAKLFAQGDSSRRRILVDASSTTAEAAADRAQAAKNLNVDAFCVVGDALTADDGAGTRGLLDSAMPVLAPGLETAVKTVAPDFPGGASVVRCEVVLGARGADESYAQGNHPLAYFFDRFARNRMAPVPGPGPRAGGPTMLVGAARAADVAKLVEAVLATKTSSVVTAGPVRPHDLAPATYTQLARACAFACGVDRARLPLYAPGNGWRERVGFPLADAPRHLDASTTAAAFPALPAVPDASRDAAIIASTPTKRYGSRKLTSNAEAEALSRTEHVLFAAVGDCYAAWRRINPDAAEGDGASFAEDEALVKDGDSLLGSLVFTRDAKYHEPLGPRVAK